MSTRIILADHQLMLRDGLKVMLETNSGFQVVAEAGDGRDAVQLARELKPDIVILETSLPGLNGIDAARQIVADHPEIRIIALSTHVDRTIIAGLLAAGARGCVEKTSPFSELMTAIQEVRGRCAAGGQVAFRVHQGRVFRRPERLGRLAI